MTPSQQAPLLVERLYELSAWLSEHNIDMQMPVGMIDPAEAAARITELQARADRAEAQCRVLSELLSDAIDIQRACYGDATGLHLAMIKWSESARLSLSGGGGAGEFAENANQGLPESPSADAGPYPRSHDDQHSDGGRG